MPFGTLAVLAVTAIQLTLAGEGADTSSSVVWNIDNLSSIGGFPVAVAGNPTVGGTEFGNAVMFDGIDDGLVVQGCPLNGSPSFTIEILFKPYASFPENGEQRVLHIQQPKRESRRMLIELRLTGNNQWFADTHIRADSSSLTCRAEGFPHPVEQWYHVALVYTGGKARHYVNGVEEMEGAVPYVPIEQAEVSLGMRMNKRWFFKGTIRSVGFTRRALRPDQFALEIPDRRTPDSAMQLLFSDDFTGTGDWIAEFEDPSGSSLSAANGILEVSASAGATIWYRHKLSGNLAISYDVTVVDSGGRNDRISDLNAFWMASDPIRGSPFPRDGKFPSYDDLDLYYAGMGGHDNTTTRFRRYRHRGGKPILREYTDRGHLLEGNRVYSIEITVRRGKTTFAVGGRLFFEYADEEPLTEGYFAFRTTRSHQRISNFRVHRLAP